MENVKYIHHCQVGNDVDFYFKIHDRLADFIRANTRYTEEELSKYLDEKNILRYRISPEEGFEAQKDAVVETIERISNEEDDTYFFNHLISYNGSPRSPRSVHDLMHEGYGLADINDGTEENGDIEAANLEWWVAHFFIHFSRLLFDAPLERFETGQSMVENPVNVSDILNKLKEIDTIVVVDDVRKYSTEEVREYLEKVEGKGKLDSTNE